MICRVAAALWLALASSGAAACRDDVAELRGPWGRAEFTIEIADDPGERSQGLMFRESLGRRAGMLFIYDRPQSVSFWMKNTLIPLDMIFVGPDGIVEHVHADAKPQDLTPIPGGNNILMVLEIAGGAAARLGIAPGSELRHPRLFQPEAVWSCDTP